MNILHRYKDSVRTLRLDNVLISEADPVGFSVMNWELWAFGAGDMAHLERIELSLPRLRCPNHTGRGHCPSCLRHKTFRKIKTWSCRGWMAVTAVNMLMRYINVPLREDDWWRATLSKSPRTGLFEIQP